MAALAELRDFPCSSPGSDGDAHASRCRACDGDRGRHCDFRIARCAEPAPLAAYALSSNFILVVVPMFILMGEVLSATGIGAALFRAAELWFRRLPGALAIATVWACAAFGAVCGSSPVTASTIGAMAVPQMLRRGYRSSLALGATAAGGTLGILIPPSISMIVYGVITDTSIGHLFMAGIVPGIMLATLMSMTIVVIVLCRPMWAPPITEQPHPRGKMDSRSAPSPRS